jgi:hypothetical protein
VSLLAIAVCQAWIHQPIYRYREQAHSYIGMCRPMKNAPIIADRGVLVWRAAGYAAIDNLSLFIALFSS